MPRRRRPEITGRAGTLVQLSTRVPGELRRRVRLVCVEQERDLQDLAEALREKLTREGRNHHATFRASAGRRRETAFVSLREASRLKTE